MKTDYIKYQHVEKLGTTEVDGLLIGDVYIFPKIDGTNAQAWWDAEEGVMRYGSRTRELSLSKDNAGFMREMMACEALTKLCREIAPAHVFGEWLVPHSLKTYQETAWRKFYVFDITLPILRGEIRHAAYEDYQGICRAHGVEYIAPTHILHNPSIQKCVSTLKDNTYLLQDGQGEGEGVVLKNYGFVNKYGRQTWAKIVSSEFKDKHCKEMGPHRPLCTKLAEDLFVHQYCTEALIEKVYAKICLDMDGWRSCLIPRLLQTVFYDMIRECTWDAVKKMKYPTINYKVLNQFTVAKIKQIKPGLF